MRATNVAFDVTTIGDLCAGDRITLTVEQGSHSLTADAAGLDTGILTGGTRTVTVDAEPATDTYRCSLHGRMTGELRIVG